jgi:hypothetical protein
MPKIKTTDLIQICLIVRHKLCSFGTGLNLSQGPVEEKNAGKGLTEYCFTFSVADCIPIHPGLGLSDGQIARLQLQIDTGYGTNDFSRSLFAQT